MKEVIISGLIGLIIGHYLPGNFLLVITIISCCLALYLCITAREMEKLVAVWYTATLIAGNICMWISFFTQKFLQK